MNRSGRPTLRHPALVVLALAGLSHPARLPAQEDESPVFGESVVVQVVNVEVVVSDRSGERVTGLTREDFELLVDGEPVAIDYFSEIADPGGPAAAAVPPAETRKRRRAPRPETSPPRTRARPVRSNILIFVDDVFAVHTRKRLVIKNLIRQLPELAPDDRVAIVSWTGRRLEVRTPWTSSREDIERVLREAADYPSRGIYPRYSPLDDLAETMTAAASALRLAGVPEGRRIMLLLAGGWPPAWFADDPFGLATGEDRAQAAGDAGFAAFQRLWLSRYASPFHPLVDAANSLGYTIYPVSTEGLPASGPGVTADRPGSGGGGSGLGPTSEVWEGAIPYLARETGGRILWAGNRFRALGRALDDGRSYYLLGFTSDSQEADRHRIQVRLRDARLRLRFRRSFVDFDSRMSAHSLLEAGLLSGGVVAPTSGRLDLRVVDMRTERRRTRVAFEVGVPVARLTFLPDAEGDERARVELSFGVVDHRGALSDITTLPLDLAKPRRLQPADIVIWRQDVTIRPRPHDLMTVLRDLASDETLLGRAYLDPPRRKRHNATAALRPR